MENVHSTLQIHICPDSGLFLLALGEKKKSFILIYSKQSLMSFTFLNNKKLPLKKVVKVAVALIE